MATQRITIAKVGGIAADIIVQRLQRWTAARLAGIPRQFSSEQWPQEVRRQADEFADGLRTHGLVPPVLHFIEWADPWSMGNLFDQWLAPREPMRSIAVHADRFQVYGYTLPDGGHLAHHLANAGPQQFDESKWFIARLQEALAVWHELIERSVLVVLRQVVDVSKSDEEVLSSLNYVPDWLVEPEPQNAKGLRASEGTPSKE